MPTSDSPPAERSASAERSRPERLKKRREFLAAAKARKQAMSAMVVQARRRAPDEGLDGVRVGFTASKKVGGAVQRNRAKRRLRAAADAVLPERGRDGWDYVLIARADATAAKPFEQLLRELAEAIDRLHAPGRDKPRRKRRDDPSPRATEEVSA